MKRVTLLMMGGKKRVARRWQSYREDGLYDWKIGLNIKAGDYVFTMSGDPRATFYMMSMSLGRKVKLETVRMSAMRSTEPVVSWSTPPASPSSR